MPHTSQMTLLRIPQMGLISYRGIDDNIEFICPLS